jgi:probable F420-dependent oxidoreductase
MDLGVALPQFDYSSSTEDPPPWHSTRDYARRAERAGFRSVWLADHLFLSMDFKYGGPPGRHRAVDPLVGLAALARSTTRVRLGTLVLCAQLRPPAVVAKALGTLDRVSGGRLTVGLGAGWFEPEYEEAGVPFERPRIRLAQLAEVADVITSVLEGGPVDFRGAHYHCAGARCRPAPVQDPRPPVWIGGRGDRLLEVVAGHADGWNTVWVWTPDDYRQRLSVLAGACERVGRDPATVTLSLGLTTLVGESEADVARRFERLSAVAAKGVVPQTLAEFRDGRLVGTVEQVREQLAGWRDLGVATLILNPGALPFGASDPDDLELLASALP